LGQPRHPPQSRLVLLAAPLERTSPYVDDMVAKGRERVDVGGHGVVIEEPARDPSQPLALFWDRLVHAPSQRLLDFQQLGPHAVASAFPVDQELAGARLAADEREAQEMEGFRFA
jgi:hypothetical protein